MQGSFAFVSTRQASADLKNKKACARTESVCAYETVGFFVAACVAACAKSNARAAPSLRETARQSQDMQALTCNSDDLTLEFQTWTRGQA